MYEKNIKLKLMLHLVKHHHHVGLILQENKIHQLH